MANVTHNDSDLIKVIQQSVETKILKSENGSEYVTGEACRLLSADEIADKIKRERKLEDERDAHNALEREYEHKSWELNYSNKIYESDRKKRLDETADARNIAVFERERRIEALDDAENLEKRERNKRTRALEEGAHKIPLPECVNVASLTGVVDFKTQHKADSFHVAPAIIHVKGYNHVVVCSDVQMSGQRIEFCSAKCPSVETTEYFKYGTFYDQEFMIIALQSLFVPTPTVGALLNIVGRVQDESALQCTDDGISQSVAVKSGIASTAEVKLPNPVVLQPFRTFLEIEQPPSNFILRMRKSKGGSPEFAFFVADGGLWKLTAISAIKTFFKDQGVDLPIIG